MTLSQIQEILQDPHPCALALFRMELAGKEIALLDGRVDADAVFGPGCNISRISRLQILGVDKIDVAALRDPPEQPAFTGKTEVIPANLGDLAAVSFGDPAYPARQQA